MFVVNAKKYTEVNIELLKILINESKMFGIYVTINKPYVSIKKILEKNNIDTERIFFIDCITKTSGGNPEITENCLYIASPKNLTELGVALSQAMSAMKSKENKFLFLDSLSTLLIYNTAGTVAQFSHFLATKLRLFGLKGIFISIEKEMDEKMLLTLMKFCDEVITLE